MLQRLLKSQGNRCKLWSKLVCNSQKINKNILNTEEILIFCHLFLPQHNLSKMKNIRITYANKNDII